MLGTVLGPSSQQYRSNYSCPLSLKRQTDFFFLKQTIKCIIINYDKCTEGKKCCAKHETKEHYIDCVVKEGFFENVKLHLRAER